VRVRLGRKERMMKPSGEEEYQRFMGFPTSILPWNAERPESRATGGRNYRKLMHPVVWLRWRIAVRRRGPYAPDFEEFRRGPSEAV
jgi:hypothetical protein